MTRLGPVALMVVFAVGHVVHAEDKPAGAAHAASAGADTNKCTIIADYPLLVKASREQLWFRAPQQPCKKLLAVGEDEMLHLVPSEAGEQELQARTVWLHPVAPATKNDRSSLTLQFLSVPASVRLGQRSFDIKLGDTVLGRAVFIVQSLDVTQQVDLHYTSPFLNSISANKPVSKQLGARAAAVSIDTSYQSLRNDVALTFPTLMNAGPDYPVYWVIERTSWGSDVAFRNCNAFRGAVPIIKQQDGRDARIVWSSDHCQLATEGPLSFGVTSTHTDKLTVVLNAYGAAAAGPDANNPFVQIEVDVATEARHDFLPLPLSQTVVLRCDGDRQATNNKTISVSDSNLRDHHCFLHYDPSASEDITRTPWAFGPQTVTVTVARQDTQISADSTWLITNPASSVDYVVSVPSQDTGGAAPYQISATPLSSADSGSTDPALRFTAFTRTRGPFGWASGNGRAFVTIPVEITTLRFPAAIRDLQSTSQTTSAQISLLRIGVLGAIEPWDYLRGKNLWAVPFRFLIGMHLFTVGAQSPAFEPSFVVGGSITLPLVDTISQLGTSLALGGFYELDLRDNRSYFLMTLGFNVLSLFGPSQVSSPASK